MLKRFCFLVSMPGLSDRQRKMRLIQYAEETRKQVIKLYALSKWARVADDVQKVIVSIQ